MREKLIELLMDMPFGCSTYEEEERHMEDLADYLIANGVTVQQWIPVTERLPEEWEAVLVYSWCGFCETAVYLGVPGKWRVTWDHTMMDDGIVTHWMPLPQPPKE